MPDDVVLVSVPIALTDQNFSRFRRDGSSGCTVEVICRSADDVLSDKTFGTGPDNKQLDLHLVLCRPVQSSNNCQHQLKVKCESCARKLLGELASILSSVAFCTLMMI